MKTVCSIMERIRNGEVVQLTTDELQNFVAAIQTHLVCCEFHVKIEGRFVWINDKGCES